MPRTMTFQSRMLWNLGYFTLQALHGLNHTNGWRTR